jgi:hypothetical protein
MGEPLALFPDRFVAWLPSVSMVIAAVPWRAQTKLVGGGTEGLVGVSLLRFDADGLVVEERDAWVEHSSASKPSSARAR